MSPSKREFFKLSKAGRKPPAPIAITHEALLAKSKVHAKRSIEAKSQGQETECQLWAATSLELLAKAQLAGIQPSLVVEVEKGNLNTLLEACGVLTGTSVKCIGAAEAYARLKHTVANFTTPVFAECRKLADRRNAELHSGEAACAAVPYDAWEGDFWNAADLILASMDMNLREWLGADAKAPKELLKAHRTAEKKLAVQRVKHHAQLFGSTPEGKLGKDKFAALVAQTLTASVNSSVFHYHYAKHWHQECPSCRTWGFAGGDEEWEEPVEDQSAADHGYQIIERSYSPSEFHCPTCHLSLVGDIAVHAAGIVDSHVTEREEEIQYEPEYGND
jgi:hypothetical protein